MRPFAAWRVAAFCAAACLALPGCAEPREQPQPACAPTRHAVVPELLYPAPGARGAYAGAGSFVVAAPYAPYAFVPILISARARVRLAFATAPSPVPAPHARLRAALHAYGIPHPPLTAATTYALAFEPATQTASCNPQALRAGSFTTAP